MKVAGLDLSLKGTGVCVLSGDCESDLEMKTYLLSRPSISGVRASIERLLSISDEIIDIIEKENIMSIIIEAPAQNQKWQAAAIGELHGVVKTNIFKKINVVPMVEQATKMRKAIVGQISSSRMKVKGKDGKVKNSVDYGMIKGKRIGTFKKATIKDIIEQRLRERGLSFASQDEMDAYVAARFGWELLSLK